MNDDDAVFCVECGTPVSKEENQETQEEAGRKEETVVNICKNCGAELEEDSMFCTTCGMKCE